VLVLPALLASASALVWGTGDFCGGKASQRSNALAVTVLSQVAGLPILVGCVAIFGGSLTARGALWGSLAGLAGFFGIVLLYRGLSQGAMAIFAPVTAVTGALVPMVFGLLTEELPSATAIVGAVLAVIAVGLVSLSGGRHLSVSAQLFALALASGTCFGLFFVLLARVGDDAGAWPLPFVRAASIGGGVVAMLLTRTPPRLQRPSYPWALVAGSFDIGANALYLAAVDLGKLAVIGPISALYPVSTVVLALLVDRERMRPAQLAGLGLAAAALVLVAT
jgi:drug/metabolite transporter (DMT)-like permease